ncbi:MULTISPECIES: MarR family winged helix-turn-helix transcriptional regulator [unclassified Curtobacterium]|uniref:MarR family winged helix-turn-helix transcriptional regulator n=1 Tax=unclassified Curtobacterium TaxID=257496 RepID=UPI0008DD798C|nr:MULTISPECIES: MarR family transcriptional regulator [unclassified Curtobacterium]OIH96663.1 transcriptional regulator [Curtobacterium sp. MCBA15_003]OII33303.1 transcriptional regulator [Curtobacterium sp. MMLR14_006]
MPKIDPLTTAWSDDEVAVMHALRDWAVTFDELNRHLSTWMHLPVSDANALGQVVWAEQAGEPISPAQLARRIGMTSGATTVLVDRLVTAGHVERHRESTDRRRVTLRPTEAARAENGRFLAFAGTEIATALVATDPEEARLVTAFLARMTEAAATANTRLVQHRKDVGPRAVQSTRGGS